MKDYKQTKDGWTVDPETLYEDEPALWVQISLGALMLFVLYAFLCVGDYFFGG